MTVSVIPAPQAFEPRVGTCAPDASVETAVDPRVGEGVSVLGRRADGRDPAREAHRLTITPEGVRIVGASDEGVFRGLTTWRQLASGGEPVPCGTITDAPRLAWRGQSLDVVRTFHPVETVEKVIDLMAHYKMNVLHLHLTDSEGWRLPVPGRDELTTVGGATARDGRPGGSYSAEELAQVVAYASERFVTVVPEFDSPGHVAALLRAYPELAPEAIRALPEGMQHLSLGTPGVRDLVADVYAAMAAVANGERLHVGGDESLGMPEEEFTEYVTQAMALARATGKGVVAWQEASRAGFEPGDIAQWWIPAGLVERSRGALPGLEEAAARAPEDRELAVRLEFARLFSTAGDDVTRALEQGADVLVSQADVLYLDTQYTEPSADPAQDERHRRVGMPAKEYGNGSVEDSFAFDPLTLGVPADRVAGVESCLWCETIEDADDLFFQLLPRLPGVAEKGWSAPTTWPDYRERLRAQASDWDARGLTWFRSSAVWEPVSPR